MKRMSDAAVAIRLPAEMRASLESRAASMGTTLSVLVREFVATGLESTSARPGARNRTWIGPVRLEPIDGGCIIPVPEAALVREGVVGGDWVWIALEGFTPGSEKDVKE